MTQDELLALVSAPEDPFLERKLDTTNRGELRQALVAFANSVPNGREAVLFIGIGDDGTIHGVANPDEKQKLIRLIASQDCYPPVECKFEVLPTAGKHVVAVVVPASAQKPHFAGPAYVRVGSESIAATQQQYEELIASRHEKCRVLQTWRNQLITLRETGFRLQTMQTTPAWNATRQGFVLHCTPHTIRFRDTSDTHFTLPIHQVDISYDEQRHRKMLIIHPG